MKTSKLIQNMAIIGALSTCFAGCVCSVFTVNMAVSGQDFSLMISMAITFLVFSLLNMFALIGGTK